MDPKSIMIDDVKYVREDSVNAMEVDTDGLKYCVVRCKNAGVHSGYVASRNGTEVILLKSRRLYKWWGETLSGLALDGTTNPGKCRFANELPEITVLDACEVIPCTKKATDSLRGVDKWKND